VARAKARGLKAANGLGMLVNQGALAFRLWNPGLFSEKSGEPDKTMEEIKEVMKDAAKAEMKGAK